jgi:hypothetical protein
MEYCKVEHPASIVYIGTCTNHVILSEAKDQYGGKIAKEDDPSLRMTWATGLAYWKRLSLTGCTKSECHDKTCIFIAI